MAKATGVDAGTHAVTVVELDGSYKKPRLTRIHSERVAPLEAAPGAGIEANAIAEAAAVAVGEAGVAKDGLRMSFPSGGALFRVLDVPFQGRDTLRKVIKGEVEGSIHSHSVDDMVVDFYPIEELEEGTRVLTAAVPKSALRVQIQAIESEGLEAEFIDLDAQALFRCAEWCGAFGDVPAEASSDEEAGAAVPAPVSAGAPVRVVLDVGSRSTRVLLVQDGVLQEVRAMRMIGGDTIADTLARSYPISAESAAHAAWGCLAEGRDQEVDKLSDEPPVATEAEGEPESEGDVPVPRGETVTVSVAEANKAVDLFCMRMKRELQRFLTSAPISGPIDRVWVTGGGSRWPGVDEAIREVFGVTPNVLPVLERLNHRLDEDEVMAYERELAVAVGLALPGLGGPSGFNFRQEDLAFTRGFDRIKFPLAVACMVALFLLVVHAVRRNHELNLLETEYAATYVVTDAEKASGKLNFDYQFFGYISPLVNVNGDGWFARRENLDRSDYQDLLGELADKPVFGRLRHLYNKVKKMLQKRQAEIGIYQDLQLPSGLAVLTRFAGILLPLEAQLGRYQVLDIDYSRPAQTLKVKLAFRGSDMRDKAVKLDNAINADIARDDGPFLELKTPKGDPFKDGGGMYYDLTIVLKPDYDPYL